MAISNNFRDKDNAAWKENATDGGVDRRTCDITTHSKLDDVVNAIGGTSDTTTTVINKAVPTAGVEVSQALPANTKAFRFRSRSRGTLILAYGVGETATNYITVIPGNTYKKEQFYSSQTLYFKSSKSGDVIELEADV